MNLLKSLWNKLVNKTSTSPTMVLVQEDPRPLGEVFAHLCREAGVKQRDLDSTNAVALFEEWYLGLKTEEDILAAIADFKVAHPTINAKFNGKI